jgi:hypothetical protein
LVVNRPVPGGSDGANVPASLRLSPKKYMLLNCADAVPAEQASATALATSALWNVFIDFSSWGRPRLPTPLSGRT